MKKKIVIKYKNVFIIEKGNGSIEEIRLQSFLNKNKVQFDFSGLDLDTFILEINDDQIKESPDEHLIYRLRVLPDLNQNTYRMDYPNLLSKDIAGKVINQIQKIFNENFVSNSLYIKCDLKEYMKFICQNRRIDSVILILENLPTIDTIIAMNYLISQPNKIDIETFLLNKKIHKNLIQDNNQYNLYKNALGYKNINNLNKIEKYFDFNDKALLYSILSILFNPVFSQTKKDNFLFLIKTQTFSNIIKYYTLQEILSLISEDMADNDFEFVYSYIKNFYNIKHF